MAKSKILDYAGFRTLAQWLLDKVKVEKNNILSAASFVWVETLNNALAIQAELKAAQEGEREADEITLPDLVDGEVMTLVPNAKVTYTFGTTMVAEDTETIE